MHHRYWIDLHKLCPARSIATSISSARERWDWFYAWTHAIIDGGGEVFFFLSACTRDSPNSLLFSHATGGNFTETVWRFIQGLLLHMSDIEWIRFYFAWELTWGLVWCLQLVNIRSADCSTISQRFRANSNSFVPVWIPTDTTYRFVRVFLSRIWATPQFIAIGGREYMDLPLAKHVCYLKAILLVSFLVFCRPLAL
jgi:hypothetical protein